MTFRPANRIAALVALAILIAAAAQAADDVTVRASVDRSRISQYEYLGLTIEVSGASGASEPEFDRMDDFEVTGRSQSTQVNIVNFKMTRSTVYSYQLLPLRTGKLRVPSATVTVDRREYRTKPIAVTVVPASGSTAQGSAGEKRGFPDAHDEGIDPAETDTFIEAILDPKEAVVGQKVIVAFYLVTRARLSDLDLQRLPEFHGFWAETLDAPEQLSFTEVRVAGYRYRKALIRRYALFPLKTGELTIDPLVLQVAKRVQSRRRSRDPFGFDDPFGMFGGRTKQVAVGSPERTLPVRELPDAGKPDDFAGAVGSFSVSSQVDTTSLKAGEAITYKLTVTGDGNAKSLEPPVLDLPEGFKEYTPKVTDQTEPLGVDYRFKKEYAYILVPQKAGDYTIPAARLPYYDPNLPGYRVAKSEPVEVTVAPGDAVTAPRRQVLSKEQVLMEGQDIRYIKPDVEHLPVEGGHLLKHAFAWALLALYPLLLGVVFVVSRFRERRAADVVGTRLRKAGAEARRRSKEAGRLAESGDPQAFYGEVQRVLTSYVADKRNTAAAGLTRTEVVRILRDAGADPDLTADVDALLERCDLYRFGAQAADADQMRQDLNRATSAIDRLEKGRVLG